MKRINIIVLAVLLLGACSTAKKNIAPETTNYKLVGNISNFENKKVKLYKVENKKEVLIDSSLVKDNKFSFDFPKQTPDIRLIKIENMQRPIIALMGDGNIDMNVDAGNPIKSKIDGTSAMTKKLYAYYAYLSKENESTKDLFKQFQQTTDRRKKDSIRQVFMTWREKINVYDKRFISENKDIVGLLVLEKLANDSNADFSFIKKSLEQFSKNLQSTSVGKNIKSEILAKGATAIGGQAPDFSAPTPEGKTLSLKEVMGKVTIIDFWASWCRPCRAENPNVVKIYKKYHKDGLNIISVSLDRPERKDAWTKAIADDKMEWNHVSNLKFWQDPIAAQYHVRGIPATFILDAKGIIRGKNLRGQQLENLITELLKE